MKTKTLAIFILTAVFYSTPSLSYKDAYFFKADCKLALEIEGEFHKHDIHKQVKASQCISFIKGIIHTHNMEFIKKQGVHDTTQPNHIGYYFCAPKNVDYDGLAKKVVQDLQDKPQDLELSPAEVVIKILNENYPCPTQSK